MRRVARAVALSSVLCLPGCGAGGSGPAVPGPPPVASPAPDPCESMRLEVELLLRETDQHVAKGEMTLVAVDAETALDIMSPYTIVIPDGGANLDVPGLSPTVGVFVSAFEFERLGEGFRQSMSVEWTGTLQIRAEGPRCPPLEVRCEAGRCVGVPSAS